MRQEMEQKLLNDFPLLYDKSDDIRDSCMCFGFECGDGWYQLILDLSERLYPIIKSWSSEYDDPAPKAVQVKEKFGALRFSMSLTNEEMQSIIDEFEEKSQRICEVCGKEGEIDFTESWYACRCQDHRNK